jgi:hypothetical protein
MADKFRALKAVSLQMQVFLSYAEQDKSLARRVADGLERAGRDGGLKVWFAEREILPGQNWAEEIARALKESEAMVILLTPDALSSTQVRREIEYALGEEAYSHRVVPVMVGPPEQLPSKDIPWILKRLTSVSLPENGRQDKVLKQITEALLSAVPS